MMKVWWVELTIFEEIYGESESLEEFINLYPEDGLILDPSGVCQTHF